MSATCFLVSARACERSGKRNGAGRKSVERERSGERRSQKTMKRERGIAERKRSGERAELSAQRPLDQTLSEVDHTVTLSPYR
jgi:predicted GNAT family N-acyltransferase